MRRPPRSVLGSAVFGGTETEFDVWGERAVLTDSVGWGGVESRGFHGRGFCERESYREVVNGRSCAAVLFHVD
jgi:hypothetical protein